MHADVMRSVVLQAESLLRRTRVLLYQGVRDLRDGVVSTEAWLAGVRWDGLRAFLDAQRAVWRTEDGELAGYVQRSGALAHVVVYGAGHLVSADNGRAVQEMACGKRRNLGMAGRARTREWAQLSLRRTKALWPRALAALAAVLWGAEAGEGCLRGTGRPRGAREGGGLQGGI